MQALAGDWRGFCSDSAMAISSALENRASALSMMQKTVPFLGLDFQPMPTLDVAAKMVAMADNSFEYVVTPNVDHMIRLEAEPDLRPLYEQAGLLVNDSRILELLAKRDDIPLTVSVGADIVETLFANEIRTDEPVVVIGSTDVDVARVAQKFGLTNLQRHDAPMGLRRKPEAVQAAARFMAEHPARFHFICVGSPQQEMVALAAKQRGDVRGVGICCGASLDFLSGSTRRAPGWMQRARLEWFHRMLSEPRRLVKRYLMDGPKIFSMWRKWRKDRD